MAQNEKQGLISTLQHRAYCSAEVNSVNLLPNAINRGCTGDHCTAQNYSWNFLNVSKCLRGIIPLGKKINLQVLKYKPQSSGTFWQNFKKLFYTQILGGKSKKTTTNYYFGILKMN